MKTPEGWPGETTERVMSRISSTLKGRNLLQLDTRTYNTVCECVFEVLHRESTRLGLATMTDNGLPEVDFRESEVSME